MVCLLGVEEGGEDTRVLRGGVVVCVVVPSCGGAAVRRVAQTDLGLALLLLQHLTEELHVALPLLMLTLRLPVLRPEPPPLPHCDEDQHD